MSRYALLASRNDQNKNDSEMNAVATVESKVAVPRRVADLDKFLAERLLEDYLPAAEAWCQEMGARLLEEVLEDLESLAEDLALKKMERKRLLGPPRVQAEKALDLAAVVAKLEDMTEETVTATERETVEELSTAAETPAPEPATPAEAQTPVETPDTESDWTVREKKARKAPKAPEVAPEPRAPKTKASRRETAQSLLKWPETTLAVAEDRIGQIIGRKGVNLDSVEAEHGVRIKVPKKGKVRNVVISGPTGEHVRNGLSAIRAIVAVESVDAMLAQIAEEDVAAAKDSEFIQVRPKSKLVTETVVVHESLVPVLLGEKGKTIRNIEEVSGARVSVAEQSGSRRDVLVSGPTADTVAKAVEMIDATLPACDEVIVRSWQVGALLGFKGETIADIQKRTGAHISVPREGDVRTAVLTASTAEAVQNAKKLVLEAMSWAVRPSKPVAKADLGRETLPCGQGNRRTQDGYTPACTAREAKLYAPARKTR